MSKGRRSMHKKILAPVNTDLFLAGIAPDFARISYPLCSCLLNPGTHFIFILKEPITTKDITTGKGRLSGLYEKLVNSKIVRMPCMPPGIF